MEKSLQQLDFESLTESFSAYHCFGDKAIEILSSINQPYKDITHWNIDDLHSKNCAALFIFTDNAETFATEIDACIELYKNMVSGIFVLDLHGSRQYKKLKERWEFYNILTTHYSTLQENILHYLLFFKHFVETVGLISMDFNDFKTSMRAATFIAAGRAGAIKEAIHTLPHKNIRTLMLGMELQDNKMDNAKEDMEALSSFFGQLPDSVEVKWQISQDFGNPHVGYIAGFDAEPVCGAAHS